MKIIKLVFLFLLLLAAASCNKAPVQVVVAQQNPITEPTYTPVLPTPTIPAPPTAIPTLIPTATPLPDIGPFTFTGYWLKLSKEFDANGYQKMRLYYQDGYNLTEIAWFCVRASDNNSPDGFYFIAIDRPTTYPTAGGGYATTFFSHNFAWKLSFRNWYLHAAPWNQGVAYGCPTKNTGGCVNMRTEDFTLLVEGGEYGNPATGIKTVIPDIPVGTPFVITAADYDCGYLGQCMQKFDCRDGQDCFRKYTCQYCSDSATKWETLVSQNLSLEQLK